MKLNIRRVLKTVRGQRVSGHYHSHLLIPIKFLSLHTPLLHPLPPPIFNLLSEETVSSQFLLRANLSQKLSSPGISYIANL